MHPDVEREGYKLPKFELFNGIGDPKAHLRMYCDKLVGVGRDERILMKLFMRSLTGEALSWYIEQDPRKWDEWVDMATDFMNRFGFNGLCNKMEVRAAGGPPMEESWMKDYFIRAQEPQYYDRMIFGRREEFSLISSS
ncbi:hypothetical protein H5410_033718 [Solanum commersonii]|uniref:Retrotransposon gag domain-containing protein n=1 Tax=Solanum commersonii TaxID=4109 RepID=A0A9J5YTE3_SOLCO|nr:hypothetical protein H5410_033718 [Solanum commersonii]